MIPLRRLFVAVLVAAVALSACSTARPPAAVIEGERITDARLAQDIELFQFLGSLSRQPCGRPIQGETAESACARFTLSNVIQELLVRHYANANGVTVDDAKVSKAIGQLQTSLGGADKLSSMLEDVGLALDDLKGLAARLLLFGEVQRAIGAEKVTDAQLRQAYEANKVQFTQLHAAHILVKTKAEADSIEQQVTPANFAALAEKYSIDPGSAKNGGDLGTVLASSFDQTFVDAALALKPGQIGQPVQTQFGWHIIELVSADVQPFDQVRPQLLDEASTQAFDTWLRDRLTSATITVNPKYGRLDTSTGEVVPIRSTETGAATPTAASTTSIPVVPANP